MQQIYQFDGLSNKYILKSVSFISIWVGKKIIIKNLICIWLYNKHKPSSKYGVQLNHKTKIPVGFLDFFTYIVLLM